MRRAYKNSYVQSQKMLASTVQFSTYDQTPPPRPRQTPDSPQGTRRYEKQDGPDTRATVARSLRTQQRAYEPDHPMSTTFPTRPKTGRTSSDHRGRPNWSAFHPRAPSCTQRRPLEIEQPVQAQAWLWTTSTSLAASAP